MKKREGKSLKERKIEVRRNREKGQEGREATATKREREGKIERR